eukprot:6348926-Amphidinium_carterae.1
MCAHIHRIALVTAAKHAGSNANATPYVQVHGSTIEIIVENLAAASKQYRVESPAFARTRWTTAQTTERSSKPQSSQLCEGTPVGVCAFDKNTENAFVNSFSLPRELCPS